jgi:hypothetical protein
VSAHTDYFGFVARELGDPGSRLGNPTSEEVEEEMKHKILSAIADFQGDMTLGFAEIRTGVEEIRSGIEEIRGDMNEGFALLSGRFDKLAVELST